MKKILLLNALLLTSCATNNAQIVDKSVPKTFIAGYTTDQVSSSSCPTMIAKSATVAEYMKLGTACVKAENWKAVDAVGNFLSMQHSSSAWGPYFLSLHAEHSKDLPRARWMTELAVKKSPNEGLALYQLGRMQWEMDEKTAALETLQKSVSKNPSLCDAHVLLGQIALLGDKNSDANRKFQHAFEQDPKHSGALLGLAEVSLRNKN